MAIIYKIARVIYAQTNGASLPAAEAMASMIRNLCLATKCDLCDIAADKNIFVAPPSDIDARDKKFQMCVRVVQKMITGTLPDSVFGATRFHHESAIPDWATDLGYVAEVDGLLFYL